MNLIEESQLLKQNRDLLVDELHTLGFAEVTADTPLSEMAELMKWAGGLRDLRLATLNKRTGAYNSYSEAEWDALSASDKASQVKLGIQIRAERQQFIISKDNILSSTNTNTMTWGPSPSDVRGLTNFGEGSSGHLNDIDGEANTDLILAHAAANNQSFPAAERARAYKASTFADGGYDDPTKWSLPAIGQLWLLYKYKKEINAALTYFFGTTQLIAADWYWSSTEYSSSGAWGVNMASGYVVGNLKPNTYRVRAVAPVPLLPSPAI